MPNLVFLGLSVLDLGPMYATDRETDVRRQIDVRRALSLNAPYPMGGGIIISGVMATCLLDDGFARRWVSG